jgi:hypothetical protein
VVSHGEGSGKEEEDDVGLVRHSDLVMLLDEPAAVCGHHAGRCVATHAEAVQEGGGRSAASSSVASKRWRPVLKPILK